MTATDPDCVVKWKARTAAVRDRIGELVRQPTLTDEDRAELDELKRESSKNVTHWLVERLDAPICR